jgi:hypothetical protein
MPEKLMPNSKHHAIVIGINDYPLIGLPSLKGPVNDANDFCAWLRDPAGGNLPPENIRRVLSSDAPSGSLFPTPNQAESLFERFIGDYYDGKKEGERLYVFASGHGFGDPSDISKTALYAANARKMLPWHVAVTNYVEWLRRHAVFDEIVLIMDCCRTVNLPYEIREPQYVTCQESVNADSVRYFYAFAARRGNASRERTFADGRVSGIFTRAFIDALKVAAPDSQGNVTGQRLKDHLHNSIGSFAGDVTVKPPDIALDSTQDIIFCTRKKAGVIPVNVSLAPYSGGETIILRDGNFKEIRQVRANASQLTLELEPGLYKIAVKDTGRQKLIEVPDNDQITV